MLRFRLKFAMHLNKKGYDGVLCCEHGLSKKEKEGELAFIEAYRAADNFLSGEKS